MGHKCGSLIIQDFLRKTNNKKKGLRITTTPTLNKNLKKQIQNLKTQKLNLIR